MMSRTGRWRMKGVGSSAGEGLKRDWPRSSDRSRGSFR